MRLAAISVAIAVPIVACGPSAPAVDPGPERELAWQIEQRLAADDAVGAQLIDVEVRAGVAVLSGAVGSLEERERVLALAEIPGVAEVDGAALDVWGELGPPRGAPPAASPIVSRGQ